MLTGQVPFNAATPFEVVTKHLTAQAPRASSLAPGLVGDLDALVEKMMRKNPGERPQSARPLRREVARLRERLHSERTQLAAGPEEPGAAGGRRPSRGLGSSPLDSLVSYLNRRPSGARALLPVDSAAAGQSALADSMALGATLVRKSAEVAPTLVRADAPARVARRRRIAAGAVAGGLLLAGGSAVAWWAYHHGPQPLEPASTVPAPAEPPAATVRTAQASPEAPVPASPPAEPRHPPPVRKSASKTKPAGGHSPTREDLAIRVDKDMIMLQGRKAAGANVHPTAKPLLDGIKARVSRSSTPGDLAEVAADLAEWERMYARSREGP